MHDAHLSWCVDDGNEFLEMPAKETVVEDPVLILQALEERVLAEGLLARAELIIRAPALLFEVVDAMRKAAGEPECSALRRAERGAFVKSGVGEDGVSAEGDSEDGPGRVGDGGCDH